jgi:ubiquinone/menaquinone biosynthesis C-methylase UbiE
LEGAKKLKNMITDDIASSEDLKVETEQYYKGYDARKGEGRNDLLSNPQVLFQFLAAEAAVVRALRSIEANPAEAKVLDVGCGRGASLLSLLRMGFTPANLYGVDIRPDQIASARNQLPTSPIQCGDASQLEFADNTFDIVHASAMFLQVPDEALSGRIAAEMVRVAKPAGHILVSDWRYSKPGSSEFKAMDKKRIARLFSVGSRTTVQGVFPGQLIPPVGRFFSEHLPSLYFLVRAVFPFLVGRVTTVLQKVK